MVGKLDGEKVAILVADGFGQVEITNPREALYEAGAETTVVTPEQELIEEVSRREEWAWAKWLLIVGFITFFALSIQVW